MKFLIIDYTRKCTFLFSVLLFATPEMFFFVGVVCQRAFTDDTDLCSYRYWMDSETGLVVRSVCRCLSLFSSALELLILLTFLIEKGIY